MSGLSEEQRITLRRYLLATIMAFGALQLMARLPARFGDGNPYYLAWLAVFVSAWYLGVGPATLVFAVESLGVWFFFNPAPHGFHLLNHGSPTGLLGFVLLSGVVTAFGEANRRTSAHWRTAEDEIVARKCAERELQAITKSLAQTQEEGRRQIRKELRERALPPLTALRIELDHLHRTETMSTPLECDFATRCATLGGNTLTSSMLKSDTRKEAPIAPRQPQSAQIDEFGLESAVPWYVDGFSQRTGIATTTYVRPDFGRLPAEIEKALFRVVQECLTNIHWHSGSVTARVRLAKHDGIVTLEVEDEGNSKLPAAPITQQQPRAPESLNAGLLGLSEHMRQLGGTLQVDASRSGTIIRATVPYAAAARRAS